MPIPISKVQDRNGFCESQFNPTELTNLLPLMLHPMLMFQDVGANKAEKEAVKQVWLNSSDLGENKIEITPGVLNKHLGLLASKGFIRGEGKIFEFTSSGKKLLKESILDDEESAFSKQASKQLVAKNSYDFGKEVLIRVNHPEKFGAKYITLPKKVFSQKKIKSQDISDYKIATKDEKGELRSISSYTDEELITVLHLARNVINNASKIAIASGQSVPVHRIKAFAEMIMTELNLDRNTKKADVFFQESEERKNLKNLVGKYEDLTLENLHITEKEPEIFEIFKNEEYVDTIQGLQKVTEKVIQMIKEQKENLDFIKNMNTENM